MWTALSFTDDPPDQETMVIGELNLSTICDSRTSGTVRPLLDSERTGHLVETVDVETR